ncbi:hypothetical protein [Mycobacterium malmoense]|uniref:hypothetical protein n=1 Tax=Mycobacterium malmoense TaxID=1780 RepID=UPI00114D49A0|nr:hypothetical protein [Mycobacterium malmoense]
MGAVSNLRMPSGVGELPDVKYLTSLKYRFIVLKVCRIPLMLILEYRAAPVGTPQAAGCAITIGSATGAESPIGVVASASGAAPALTVNASAGAGSYAAVAAS